jgi:ParB/RepB/Spo0J family partition protein
MKLKISQLVAGDNLREDMGDLNDLSDSLKEMNGNVQPILVCEREDGKYDVLSGSRRVAGLKLAEIETVEVCIKKPKNDYERFMITYHENIGRKDLTWQEHDKALKQKKSLEETFLKKDSEEIVKEEAKIQNKSERTVYRQLQAADAITEFPELAKEKTRTSALKKYDKIKSCTPEVQEQIAKKQLSIDKLLKDEQKNEDFKKISSSQAVIEVMKDEIQYYKEHIFEVLKNRSKEERIKNGIFYKEEVVTLIEAARSCEAFGIRDIDKKVCVQCEKETEDIANKCIWAKEFFK